LNRLLAASLSRIALFAPGGSSVRPRLQRWRGARIGSNVWIALFVYIDELHPDALSIGDNCSIGIRTSIITHFYWGPRRALNTGKVVIENDVFIGPHCVILPNVRIGQGSVIQAGSVVSQNVPPRTLWGSPSSGPLANVTVPLTSRKEYDDFLRGLKPLQGSRADLQVRPLRDRQARL
jgi:acetyltransferase-like isoleucine patch superfamily enzyme